METYQIYLVRNLIDSKIYIGQTKRNYKRRFKEHVWNAKSHRSNCLILYNAIRKHGESNFVCELIDESAKTSKELDQLEIYYIQKYNSIEPNGYNICEGGLTPNSAVMQGKSGLTNKMGFMGVEKKGTAFRASITKAGKTVGSTTYWTIEEAAKAYDYLALEHYGELAKLNFPELLDQYKSKSIALEPKGKKHFKERIPKARSKYRGVTWENYRWTAAVYPKKGVRVYLGVFSDEVEAAKAYDAKAKELKGDRAKLNFP